MEALQFNDDIPAKAMLSKLNDIAENIMFEDIKRQAETDPHINFGAGLDVLLISDSALGRASGLHTYLIAKTNFNDVRLCIDIGQIEEYLKSTVPDIIIYIGMPKSAENYKAMSMAQKVNKQVLIVMCDFLDAIVESECRIYGIRYAFSSYKPIKDGLRRMRQMFEENKTYAP